MNFTDIEYLKTGNQRQKEVYDLINKHNLWEILCMFNPVLVGTIPIDIDIPSSDIDIICKAENFEEFINLLNRKFGQKSDFTIKKKELRRELSVICRFVLDDNPIEIVGQKIDPTNQIAYRHMIIEYEILTKKDEGFKKQVKKLKAQGYKTEPAFAKLLGIEGDAYLELLNYRI